MSLGRGDTKGEFLVGMGDALDPAKTMKLAVGDTGTITAKMHHFAIARVATGLSIRAERFFNDPRESRGRSQKAALVA